MKNPSFPDKLYPSQRNSTNYTRMHILVFFKMFTPAAMACSYGKVEQLPLRVGSSQRGLWQYMTESALNYFGGIFKIVPKIGNYWF